MIEWLMLHPCSDGRLGVRLCCSFPTRVQGQKLVRPAFVHSAPPLTTSRRSMKKQLCLTLAYLSILACLGECCALETIDHQDNQIISTQQWRIVDIRFHVETPSGQPTDLEFTARFKSDSGVSLDVPGFFNGNNEYLIRFTPSVKGNWNYVTNSSLAELHGRRGKLNATAAPDGRKGGVVIDPKSPRQFRYENGGSYYPIAFECDWLFALDAENPSDIPNTRKLVDTLAANGFNQIVLNVFAYDVNWKKDERLIPEHDYGSPRVFPFGGNNESPDHSQLNIEYFKRLDRVIDYLDKKGIIAHLMVYVWNKQVNWPQADSEADNRYFDYVISRYQAFPNLIWDISKEALGYGHTDVTYIHKRVDRLRQLDAFKRLITVHDYGYCRRFAENVDFVSVQLWSSELHSVMRKVCDDIPGKPILNIEHGGYEKGPYVVFTGNYTSPEVCLERAWQCVFAGTFPTHYWQGAAWNVVVADIESLAPVDRPRLDYYRHMRNFVDKYEVGRLAAGEKYSNAGFSLHNGQDRYLYYVPKECEFIGLRLPKKFRGQMMMGTWFNPFDGGVSESTTKEIVQWPAFTKPSGNGFRILIVEIMPRIESN